MPDSAFEMPHTISTVIRYREMIDGFMELPKDKRPPENIWFDGEKLEDWFEDVFKTDSHTVSFDVNEVEG